MRSILKCIYVILFLILIASSSALFILVASESMQNIQKTSNRENKGQELNTKENLLHENLVESESVSCDKEDSKINKNFKTNSDESSDVLNENVWKIGEEINYLGPDETINSPEILHKKETIEPDEINEPYRAQFNEPSDSNIKIEINTTSKQPTKIIASSSFDDQKMNSFANVDESYNDPPISRDIPPDKIEQNIIDTGGSLVIAPILSEEHQTSLEESAILSDSQHIKKSERPLKPNITEEKPIPVFSEWAQKQMEEAEKKLEKNVGNTSSMKKNITNGNKPAPNLLKLRVKNYASPDCGAKIITSNSEAQNTGALLTSSKDEYMLSPCTSRIWFVVELCEAIQAKQIDFANFELFSSSPKNFTVSVSNRFPTRDWSNVGRFIAEDTRNIQSFDLYPHLFGKYVRVEVHSHYNSEHFCPISLLRVYGTSEFEAFDSENRNPYEDIDDVDDDIVQVEINKKEDNNLFKSASDAVMSIVKKAAQVLTKEKSNRIEFQEANNILCFTPAINGFECSNCSQITIDNVNYILSCKYKELIQLLSIRIILDHLLRSQICFDRFNIDISVVKKSYFENLSKNLSIVSDFHKSFILKYTKHRKTNLRFHDQLPENNFDENEYLIDEKQSYYLSSINSDYLGAMCHILKYQTVNDLNFDQYLLNFSNKEATLNLTLEKKSNKPDYVSNGRITEEMNIDNNDNKKVIEKDSDKLIFANGLDLETLLATNSNEIKISIEDSKENQPNSEILNNIDDTSSQKSDPTIMEGVNIFNIIDDSIAEDETLEIFSDDISKEKSDLSEYKLQFKLEENHESITSTPIPPTISSKTKEDDSQWETEERFFNEHLNNDINLNSNSAASNIGANQHKSSQHTESVFTRLSNRIKALERNMSLSGQYLEELSRRYKKQVEELQTSFSKTLTAIENQNHRFTELELALQKQNAALQTNLDELNVKLHFWMFVLIIVTTIGLIYILTSFYSVTLIGRRQKSLYKKFEESNTNRKENEKLKRRKSTDGVSRNSNSSNKKTRRPSEEAMKINGSYKDLMIDDQSDNSITNLNSCEEYGNYSENSDCNNRYKSNVRNRKLSICYSKDNQPILKKNSLPIIYNNSKLEQNYKDFNKFSKIFYDASNKMNDQSNNGSDIYCDEPENETIPEELIVVDDETDQMIACNTGYEYLTNKNNDDKSKNNIDKFKKINNNNNNNNKPKKSDTSVKIRRLSSPSFLKSPFNKKTTTESTGWEWIRNGSNKNRQKKIAIQNNSNNKEYFKYVLNNSLDSERDIFVERNPSPNSTVSEQIIFHNSINNSENDSLRTTNSEDSSLQASVEGTSNSLGQNLASSSSTTTNGENNGNKNKTKKQRSFKKIFKKVF